jgi:hypothetical protein
MTFLAVTVMVLVWILCRKRRKPKARRRFYLTRTYLWKPEESAWKHLLTSRNSDSFMCLIGFDRIAVHSLRENFERHWTRTRK